MGGGPDVHIRVLYPREYEKAARIARLATRDASGTSPARSGPYPYRQVTVVVPPYNAIESGGMEYETFFTTIGALGPPLLDLVRFVTVHEFGHGYFMGLLASNEFEEPFLDEGLNEFWDARMLETAPLRVSAPGLLGEAGAAHAALRPGSIWSAAARRRFQADPIAGNSWDRWSRRSYGLVYSRTALVFHDLEQRLGGDVLSRGFREYYRRWRFRHPSTADLEEALAESGGQVVRQWFAEQVYASAAVDDRVESIETRERVPEPGTSVQPDGARISLDEKQAREQERAAREAFHKAHPEAKGADPGPFPWESVVQARRYAAHVPQQVTFRFEDGEAETVDWPAEERWHRWVFERPVRISSVQLDPERKSLLNLDKLDDGRTRERAPLASRRWGLELQSWASVALSLLEAL